MILSDCHRKKKPLAIRGISLFVVIAFVVTQLDLRSAYASPTVPVSPSLSVDSQLDPSRQKENIHHMQNINEWDFPLAPSAESGKLAGDAVPVEEKQPPQDLNAQFQNPLVRPEGDALIQEFAEGGNLHEAFVYARS